MSVSSQNNVSRVQSSDRMSNSQWNKQGRPTWWVRVGQGTDAEFLEIPKVRGDSRLDVEVDVEPGTKVTIGVGKDRGAVRETVVTEPLEWDASHVAGQIADLLADLNDDQRAAVMAIVQAG